MRHALASLVLALFLFPSIAMGETIDFHALVKTDGFYHKPFNQSPFTGNVTGVYQGYLKNGKKHGPWSDFWDEGRIANTRTYKDGILVSHTIYRKNGTVEVRKNYKLGSSGLELDGSYEDYWDNGQLLYKGTYKNGKQHGPWVTYHKNGQLAGKGTSMDGKKDGPYVSYHENGQLQSKGTQKENYNDGPWVRYYDNGQLNYKGTYKDGKKVGPWVYYGEDGTLLTELTGTYKNGVKVK